MAKLAIRGWTAKLCVCIYIYIYTEYFFWNRKCANIGAKCAKMGAKCAENLVGTQNLGPKDFFPMASHFGKSTSRHSHINRHYHHELRT